MGTPMLTIFEVAERLGVTDKTMRNWAKTGHGPQAYRIGVALKYERDEVEAWIDAQKVEPEPLAA